MKVLARHPDPNTVLYRSSITPTLVEAIKIMSSNDISKLEGTALAQDPPTYGVASLDPPPPPPYNAATQALNVDNQLAGSASPASKPKGSHQFTEEEKLQMLREFQHHKEYANDYWGGHKGAPEGPPKDPLKVFRWAGRKISRDEDPAKRPPGSPDRWYDRSRSQQDGAADGEVAKGDIDTSRLA